MAALVEQANLKATLSKMIDERAVSSAVIPHPMDEENRCLEVRWAPMLKVEGEPIPRFKLADLHVDFSC